MATTIPTTKRPRDFGLEFDALPDDSAEAQAGAGSALPSPPPYGSGVLPWDARDLASVGIRGWVGLVVAAAALVCVVSSIAGASGSLAANLIGHSCVHGTSALAATVLQPCGCDHKQLGEAERDPGPAGAPCLDPSAHESAPPQGDAPPIHVPLELARIRSLRRKGRLSEAVEAMRPLMKVASDASPVLAEGARLSLEMGDSSRADSLAKRAAEQDPSAADPFLLLATIAVAREDSANAALAYSAYLARDPTGKYAQLARRYLRRHGVRLG